VLEALRGSVRGRPTSAKQLATIWEGVSVQWRPRYASFDWMRGIAGDTCAVFHMSGQT